MLLIILHLGVPSLLTMSASVCAAWGNRAISSLQQYREKLG